MPLYGQRIEGKRRDVARETLLQLTQRYYRTIRLLRCAYLVIVKDSCRTDLEIPLGPLNKASVKQNGLYQCDEFGEDAYR